MIYFYKVGIDWKNELKNQCVHLLLGLWISIILCTFVQHFFVLYVPLCIGIAVEIYQYFYVDNKELDLIHRLIDISVWGLSSMQTVIITKILL